MYEKNRILAFIGARAGSKGLKNKNIIDFAGDPLINWTIKASLNSELIDKTIVSTDSQEIAEIAKNAGADVPFLRPHELSEDHVPLLVPIKHCIEWVKENEVATYDYIVALLPTCPLRTSKHIDQAIEYFFKNKRMGNDTLVSVRQMSRKYGWLMKINVSGYIDFINKSPLEVQRQDLPELYLPNGAIFMGAMDVVEQRGFYTDKTLHFIMDEKDSIDIDTAKDLELALKNLE